LKFDYALENGGCQGHPSQGPGKKIVEGFPRKTQFFWQGEAYPWRVYRCPHLCMDHHSQPGTG